MNTLQQIFAQKKTVIIEGGVLILVLIGSYYLYSTFSVSETTTTKPAINQSLLGKNFILLLKLINQDKVSFKDTNLPNSQLLGQLQDFSEVIAPTAVRGRDNPFAPYDSSRPLR
jgi:LPS O-antigen subunit length determinant protein (WzzB/FepE family)